MRIGSWRKFYNGYIGDARGIILGTSQASTQAFELG